MSSFLERCKTAQTLEFRNRVMVAAMIVASEVAATKPSAAKKAFVAYVNQNPERAAAVIALSICANADLASTATDEQIKTAISNSWSMFAGE